LRGRFPRNGARRPGVPAAGAQAQARQADALTRLPVTFFYGFMLPSLSLRSVIAIRSLLA